jgi:putative oxidoreductase
MGPILAKWDGPIYGLMRIVIGFMFACNGAQKLFAVFGGTGEAHGLYLAAGIVEMVCGPLVMLGLFTSYAALIAAGEMAASYAWIHLRQGFLPILNRGELAAIFLVVFLYIAARGSGSFSLDGVLGKGRGKA